jgi:hypothetical protein
MAAARHDQYQMFFAGPLVFLIGCELVLATFSNMRRCPGTHCLGKAGGHDHCQIFFAGPMVSQIGYEESMVTIRGFEVRPGTHCGRDGCGSTISTKYFSLVQSFLNRV